MMKNLLLRILTAAALLPVVIFAFLNGGYFLLALLCLVGGFCIIEAADIILPKSAMAKTLALVFFLGLFLPMLFLQNTTQLLALFSVAIFTLNTTVLFTKNCSREIFEKLSTLFFVCLYIFIGLSCAFWLQKGDVFSRNLGIGFVLIACVATWINDSFAYFAGNLFGKRPLFKEVSQKKSWEGFWGGSFFTALFALIIAYFSSIVDVSFLKELEIKDICFIILPVIILGPIGDLIESRIKRFYQVKDASNLLPGHGGLLDRIDSLLVILPWTALYAFIIRPLY